MLLWFPVSDSMNEQAKNPNTKPVCDPAQNNGFQYLAGTVSHDILIGVSNQGQMSDHDCCALCYAPRSKCFVYEHNEGNCIIVTETSGNNTVKGTGTATDWCPLGIYNITSPGNGTFYGPGPCAVFD
jgi:hypothetical protein